MDPPQKVPSVQNPATPHPSDARRLPAEGSGRPGSIRGGRPGFTLIETLMVLALIMALSAVLLPTLFHVRRSSQVKATAGLVRAVSAAITAYPLRDWTWRDPNDSSLRSKLLWDLDDDHLVDGDPALAPGAFPAGAQAAGYRGLLAMAQPPLGKQYVDAQRRVVDAWRRPLRIHFAIDTYGSSWFGIHSVGPDGLDATGDDIRSWEELK